MSYGEGTILKRSEPKGDKFDRLTVVGVSPIKSTGLGEWAGSGPGDCIIVNPTDEFGAPQNLPIAIANTEYDIEFEPEEAPTHIVAEPKVTAQRLLTPEESFRRDAKRKSTPSIRKRTPITHE